MVLYEHLGLKGCCWLLFLVQEKLVKQNRWMEGVQQLGIVVRIFHVLKYCRGSLKNLVCIYSFDECFQVDSLQQFLGNRTFGINERD